MHKDLQTVNIYALSFGAPNFIKQIGLNIIVVGYFNILLSSIDRPSRQKSTKKLQS
jgi:hypothetical protein